MAGVANRLKLFLNGEERRKACAILRRRSAEWVMGKLLSTELDSPTSIPYFLWDEPMSVAELRQRLASGTEADRMRLLGKIMREARDTDVWKFTTPRYVRQNWAALSKHLGRRRGFWEFLLGAWEREGLLEGIEAE